MKTGYKTTEFWLAAAAAVVGLLLTSGAFEATGGVVKALGVAAAALASVGYSVSRGKAKGG